MYRLRVCSTSGRNKGVVYFFRWCLIVLLGLMVVSSTASAKTETELGGILWAHARDGERIGACPLEHTDVQVEISGNFAEVTVTQDFSNPFSDKINAVYTFPLPASGAVYEMEMKVAERVIRGQIFPREKAREIYEEAVAKGHVAAILDQERPNIFTQSVANIEPGKKVSITIRYYQLLTYEEDLYKFVFPTVVGPRYIPGRPLNDRGDTDQVPDGSRISPPLTPEDTRGGHDISIAVDVHAGSPLQAIRCETHEVETVRNRDGAQIRLAQRKTIPNKDFILEYSTAQSEIRDSLLTHRDGDSGYFAFILQPPTRVQSESVAPKELVFVVDVSGSMRGEPLNQVVATMRYCLKHLNPQDTFNLITFAGHTRVVFPEPVPVTDENLKTALSVLEGAEGAGGTEMMQAIRAALTPSDSQQHLRIVTFMTDGYVSNEFDILAEIKKHPQATVFPFGVGSSVNRFLLDQMAVAGRGEADYVPLRADPEPVAKKFYERIRNPILTDVKVRFKNLDVTDVLPERLPDLFDSQPIVVVGRYQKEAEGSVEIQGNSAGKPFSREFKVRLPAQQPQNAVLRRIWARQKVDNLMASDWEGVRGHTPNEQLQHQITQLGVEYCLMTQFTSFVAVEERVITEGGKSKTVQVPVELPQGVSREGVTWGSAGGIGIKAAIVPEDAVRQEFLLQHVPVEVALHYLQIRYPTLRFTPHPTMNGFYLSASKQEVLAIKRLVASTDKLPNELGRLETKDGTVLSAEAFAGLGVAARLTRAGSDSRLLLPSATDWKELDTQYRRLRTESTDSAVVSLSPIPFHKSRLTLKSVTGDISLVFKLEDGSQLVCSLSESEEDRLQELLDSVKAYLVKL